MFKVAIETREQYGVNVKVIACIQDPAVLEKILTHLQQKVIPDLAGLLPDSRAPPAGVFG